METIIHIGVDIGQRQDPTAIVVAEVEKRGQERYFDEALEKWHLRGGVCHYVIRHLERLALDTPYPAVVERLLNIRRGLAKKKIKDVVFYLDATGVGGPIVDLLCQAGLSPLVAVYITGSDKASREGRDLRLGKALLVSRLQVLLQSERIHLPQTPEAGAMVDELLNYQIRIDEAAQATFGAFRVGSHDDLATALGLAVWEEPARVEIVPNPFYK